MQEEMDAIQAPAENNIAGTGSVTAHTARGTVHCITIVGQIEGHMELPAQNKTTKYEHLIDVYKRQAVVFGRGRDDLRFALDRGAGLTDPGEQRVRVRTCLLYTSRCV